MTCDTHENTEELTTRKTEGKKPLDDSRIRYALILISVFNKSNGRVCELDTLGSEQGPGGDTCEHGKEREGPTKFGKLIFVG
jgi:hypothetical protein